jgi:hypothetical protein
MTESATPWDVREEFERLVINDLHGPAFGEHETIAARPMVRDRYLIGMLAPADLRVVPAQQDGAGIAEGAPGSEVGENDATATQGFFPSSLGLSFAVHSDITQLSVEARWGNYRKERRKTDEVASVEGLYIEKPDAEFVSVWQRYPMQGSAIVTLAEGDLPPVYPITEAPGVAIRGKALRRDHIWYVTLFLVNEQFATEHNQDERWLFQAGLAVAATDETPIFLKHRGVDGGVGEVGDDRTALNMLYRSEVEFATGHGTAVRVVAPTDASHAPTRIETWNVPRYEVPSTDQPDIAANPLLAGVELDMSVLAAMSAAQIAAALRPIVMAYRTWIDREAARIISADLAPFHDEADAAIGTARRAADRIAAGIDVLERDADAAEAFRFANEAMWRQRTRSIGIERRRAATEPGKEVADIEMFVREADVPANRRWRLFQLAFFCLNVPGLANMRDADRVDGTGIADLLFFPTGGGKTEAYLGLVAFTFAIRRLQGTLQSDEGPLDGSGGVAVLMRYTLRLLTSQQFQRAAALVCATEMLRRERFARDVRWGATPFRLGLWIGKSTTPNRVKEAMSAIETARQRDGSTGSYGNPLQLVYCPWCGAPLEAGRDLVKDDVRARVLTVCSDPFGGCPFTQASSGGEGIPVVTTDDEIYRLLPAFIIATIDKFAQLPWHGPLHLLFGRTQRRCERHGYRSIDLIADCNADKHTAKSGSPAAATVACDRLRPPDLILQDELHLISGPLGTLAGLYEIVVDELSSATFDGVKTRPKVIASTATIRRASQQTNLLFARKLAVFPPHVLDAGENFFAVQRPVSVATPGRRYVGLCARGQRMKAAEARVAISILAAGQKLYDTYGSLADPYTTMVGYFSSLRELAGMRRLIDDDVKQRIWAAERRGLANRKRINTAELTSRIRSERIPRLLDGLGVARVPSMLFSQDGPFDVVLATNMISVGVDVQRLGLMLVVSQPKSTAEYIQSTSRVGRSLQRPGIVFTLYNWNRPRDLSHYERFCYDHATFYRQVEPLSITPFSERALDRGLTAVVVSLVRHLKAGGSLESEVNPETAAQRAPVVGAVGQAAIDSAVARVLAVLGDRTRATGLETRIRSILDRWLTLQRYVGSRGGPLTYKGLGGKRALLKTPSADAWDMWTVPTSMRETENEINLLLSSAEVMDAPSRFLIPAVAGLAPLTIESGDDDDANP